MNLHERLYKLKQAAKGLAVGLLFGAIIVGAFWLNIQYIRWAAP